MPSTCPARSAIPPPASPYARSCGRGARVHWATPLVVPPGTASGHGDSRQPTEEDVGRAIKLRAIKLRVICLCHGFYGYRTLTMANGVDPDEVEWEAPGRRGWRCLNPPGVMAKRGR